MFLKRLTVKGFKSFADRTTLDFEPGVAVVVGPNGSGKSNVVDAVAWVLGAQGARSLRGGKMEDVIFAGTPKRAAAGKAEVSLTLDNTGGLIPIASREVTITRSLTRDGESGYAINGEACRLLDITELLSHTGMGRTQHVIVGQGRLDAILQARPEDRRAVIEEAAGILKYRQRKEKAERRLEATAVNLERLGDLVKEVRRHLKPLERQADAARRHGGLTEELQAIRLHLAGREINTLTERLSSLGEKRERFGAEETVAREQAGRLEAEVAESEATLSDLPAESLGDAVATAESLLARARGLGALVTEKRRNVDRLSATCDLVAFTRAQLDLADAAAVLDTMTRCGPDVVINCAAYNDVEGAEDAAAGRADRQRARRPGADAGGGRDPRHAHPLQHRLRLRRDGRPSVCRNRRVPSAQYLRHVEAARRMVRDGIGGRVRPAGREPVRGPPGEEQHRQDSDRHPRRPAGTRVCRSDGVAELR